LTFRKILKARGKKKLRIKPDYEAMTKPSKLVNII